jgi:hypothetical protein
MSRKFVEFGNALVDQDLIGAIQVKAKGTPTIIASMGFQRATVAYAREADGTIDFVKLCHFVELFIETLPNPERFVKVNGTSWVDAEKVRSITWDDKYVTVWLDLPGATLPVRVSSTTPKEYATGLANDITMALAPG